MKCMKCGRRFSYRTPGYKKIGKGKEKKYLCAKCSGYARPTTLFSGRQYRGDPYKPGTYITRPWEKKKRQKPRRLRPPGQTELETMLNKMEKMCVVCGYRKPKGVMFARTSAGKKEKAFACIRCFENPSEWFGFAKWQQQRTLMFPGGTKQIGLIQRPGYLKRT